MTGSAGEDDDAADAASTRPGEPEEPELPGEDNPGERLISKYDPTVEDADQEEELIPDAVDLDVPQETVRLFWYLVAVFNVAVLGIAVGSMLIVFQGRWTLGGQIVLAGAVLLAYGYYRYRKHARGEATETGNGND